MIPRYFQSILLKNASLDGEITGRIARELTFSSFEVAIHYVELNQAHIRSLRNQYSTVSILRLHATHKCDPDRGFSLQDLYSESMRKDASRALTSSLPGEQSRPKSKATHNLIKRRSL